LKQTGHYLDELFYVYGQGWFSGSKTLIVLLGLLGVAFIARSLHLAFFWCFFVIGVLPVAFIPSRALSAAYIPVTGLFVCAAVVVVWGRDWLARCASRLRKRPPGALPAGHQVVKWQQPLLFLAVAFFLLRVHPGTTAAYVGWQPEYQEIREAWEQLRQLHSELPKGSRILFLRDPLPRSRWGSTFIIHLLYRDDTITVDRVVAGVRT